MNWAWASSLDEIWGSPSFPIWATLAIAAFFAVLLLITLARAERSVANGTLTVITLLAIGAAVAATIRGFGLPDAPSSAESHAQPTIAALPAMSCIDDLAGETVLTACEKTLFGSPESTAAAIAYAASRITRLTSLGDLAAANRNLTPEVESLRRSIERDRYGLMAYVLVARDHCTPQVCQPFRSLGNSRQLVANMDDRVYEGLVLRYSASWGAPAMPPVASVPTGAIAALPPAPAPVPTGKPTTMIEFPSASSTPPVNIMTPEPGAPGSAAPPSRAATPAAATPARPAAASASPTPGAPPAAKKQAQPKSARAPTQLAPPPGSPPPATASPPPAPASAAEND